jgi:hypothetical protein
MWEPIANGDSASLENHRKNILAVPQRTNYYTENYEKK